jgi:hypothetical protein
MYNPFRAHIVEFADSTFAVRRLGWSGWLYWDNQVYGPQTYWWSGPERVTKWALLGTLEQAQANLTSLTRTFKVHKVYT